MTPEDETFDELARKQGAWGGGFKAKQAMAADKQHWNEDEWRRNNWRCGHGWLRGEQCEICNAAQEPTSGDYALGYAEGFNDACKKPAQEPVREALKLALEALDDMHIVDFPLEDLRNWNKAITAIKAALAQPETEMLTIAYQSGYHDGKKAAQREWVGLTEKDFSAINQSCLTKLQAATSAESILKEKNNG